MAKKRRSAKQKAATRKLVALNKRKSNPKRRKSAPKRKTNKRKTSSRRVANKKKKSGGGKGSGGFINKIPILKNKTVQRIGFGLGMASIAGLALRAIPVPAVQQNAPLIQTGVAFAVDPLAGVVRLFLSGGLGSIGNLLGGGGGAQNGDNGFA